MLKELKIGRLAKAVGKDEIDTPFLAKRKFEENIINDVWIDEYGGMGMTQNSFHR